MFPVDSRACTKCRSVKLLSEFSKAPRGRYGVKASCKSCDAAHYAANPFHSRAMSPEEIAERLAERRGTESVCTKCGETKPRTEFSKSRDGKYGVVLHTSCKTCNSTRAYQWFLDNREHAMATRRKWNRFKFYGLTQEGYDKLMADQGGVCAICGEDEPAAHGRTGKKFELSVDHCHQTGRVRGLLCQRCNRAIGLLRDDPVILQKAINYLLSSQGKADDQGGQ